MLVIDSNNTSEVLSEEGLRSTYGGGEILCRKYNVLSMILFWRAGPQPQPEANAETQHSETSLHLHTQQDGYSPTSRGEMGGNFCGRECIRYAPTSLRETG